MTKFELAYLAGIVDGEGCLRFHANTNQRSIYPRLSIGNKNKELMEWITLKTGIRYRKQKSLKYTWETKCIKAREITRKLLPYLVTKKPQALLLLQHKVSTGNQSQDLQRNKVLVLQMKALKEKSYGR